MAPLVVQLVTWVTAWLAAGLPSSLAGVVEALRISLVVMFVFTAISHFVPRTRKDLLTMVPPMLPMPGILVTITGVLELAGAVGLALPGWKQAAANCLALLLLAMFPANAYAARSGVMIAGRRSMSLLPRLALQTYWIACLLGVAYQAAPRP